MEEKRVIDDERSLSEIKKERSSDKKNNKKKPRKKNTKRIILIIVLIILLLLGIAIFAGIGVIYHYIDKMNIVDTNSSYEILDSIEQEKEIYYDENGNEVDSMPDSPEVDISALEKSIADNIKNNTGKSPDGADSNYNGRNGSTYKFDFRDSDVYNVLLIGTDARTSGERGRSDSMILVSINKRTKRITTTSFLRDIYLYIPGVEYTRLNHSYAYGGPELLMDTLTSNFRIPIDKYVQVDFQNFKKVIDSVGGVEIDVTDAEVPYINQSSNTKLYSSGRVTLNGDQALAYSRIRYIGTDFGRTERQRKVLDQIFIKMAGMSMSDINDLLNDILPNITTNIPRDEVFDLVLDFPSYKNYERLMLRVPCDGSWWNMTIRGMAVLGIDFDTNLRYLGENIYDHYE